MGGTTVPDAADDGFRRRQFGHTLAPMTVDRGIGVDRRPTLVMVGAALVALVLGAGLGGAVAALAIGDPGPIVRWAVPLTRLLRDVGATVTVGFALVGAFLAPETTRTRRREAATRLAGLGAVAWLLGLLLGVVAEFSLISGLRPTEPEFWTQFFGLAWELQPSRLSIIGAVVVALIVLLCAGPLGKTGLAWVVALGWLALMPQALSGHSAVSRDHMSSINALAVHLVAMVTWVGGLLALVVLRRSLRPHLAVTVRRYSVVATWSYAALAVSGVLAAWFNLSRLSDLGSAYGVMMLLKALALGLLGVAGLRQRALVVRRLDENPGDRGAFIRLAVVELALMGAASGLAVALSGTPPPGLDRLAPDPTSVFRLTGYPDPGPPGADAWLTTWHTDWLWLAVAAIAIGVYLAWVRRLVARGDAWPVGRTVCWVLGWLVFVYAMCGAPGVYGRILFSWHMIMHMAIAMLVPLLLVPGAPVTLALRALPARTDKTLGPRELVLALVHSRYLRVLANPVVAAAIFFFSLAIFYFTPLFGLALSTHTGHVLMTAHFLLSGYLFTWVLIGIDPGPPRWHPLVLLMILFATISFHAFLGVVLTGSSALLAPEFFTNLGLAWTPDPLADQQRAGAIAWGVGEAPTLVLALLVTLQWVRADRRETARADRQAERDQDAELAAYNERLAELARRDERGRHRAGQGGQG